MIKIYPSRRAEKRVWKSEGFLKTWVPRYYKINFIKKYTLYVQ